jgi:YrbI family 3-deoxy-D-manno-octulosonate 8-phosphate phosphatase
VVEVLIMDVDGVLTDGAVYVDSAGNETKRLTYDDIDAIFALKEAGVKIGFITGEDGGFSDYVRRRFSPDYFVSGCKDKLGCFQQLEKTENLDRSRACYVGDSGKDVELLGYLDVSFAPSDAAAEARRAAWRVVPAKRGCGVVKEVADIVFGGGACLDYPEPGGGSAEAEVGAVAIIADIEEDIPRRGGRLVAGRPLLSYAVEACLETPGVEKVAVFTAGAGVKEELGAYEGVEVTEVPGDLSAETVEEEKALMYFVRSLEGRGREFDTVLYVNGACPLTEAGDLRRLLGMIGKGFGSASFYTEDFGYFFDEGEVFGPRVSRRRRAPRKREAGNAWAFRMQGFLKGEKRTFGRVGLCRLEPPRDLEVRTEGDLLVAERVLQVRERKRRRLYWAARQGCSDGGGRDFEAGYWGEVVDPDGNIRDRALEREQRLSDVSEEVRYINSLRPGRMLDIGCGMGELLSAVQDQWEKYGLEVSEHAAREASRYGRVFVGLLKDAPYEREYFDLVVMHHVIEHLERPDEEMERARALLKHRGKLIVATPDFDGAMARRYGPKYRLLHDKTHVSLFSRVSLRQFLEDNGFEVERESFPFFETRHFTRENLLRLLEADGVSPPFWGSFMTFYCVKK